MIEVQNLRKSFDDTEVLKGISTTFETGKVNLVIGQSGSGKTVFLNLCLMFMNHPKVTFYLTEETL
jgi:phospholipid/cholesterol/gamma-HCH transport system ATP-binding protein